MLRNTNIIVIVIVIIAITGVAAYLLKGKTELKKNIVRPTGSKNASPHWVIPDTGELTDSADAKLIKYGRSLIVNTAYYLGPKGVIGHKSNGINCQSCHLDAGTKLFGNNFSLVSSGYPRYKDRSGSVETMKKKVEDCFERSLNGKTIDSNGREMKAFVAYLKWIGKNVKKGAKPMGAGIEELPFLNRAADPAKGRMMYISKCQSCHGKNGDGVLNATGTTYTYPPLWGEHSYNIGASIYRLSKFAGYIKDNMPFKADYKNRQLTDEQAWDLAAFINSQYHPYKNIDADWPKLATKPYDYPFGPYADHLFTESQHKYGPYGPVKNYYTSISKK